MKTLCIELITSLAQAAPAAPAGPNGTPVSPFMQSLISMVPLIAIVVIMFWLMGSQRRRQERERAAMLNSIKKGDRVRMSGGELGSVVEVRDADVLIKVDESSNTKIRYVRDAVAAVITEKPGTVTGDKKDN